MQPPYYNCDTEVPGRDSVLRVLGVSLVSICYGTTISATRAPNQAVPALLSENVECTTTVLYYLLLDAASSCTRYTILYSALCIAL